MNSIKKMVILSLIFTLLGVVFSCSQKQSKVESNNKESVEKGRSVFSKKETTKVLILSNGKKIYVRARIWGISNNHKEIVFSETPITTSNKEKDYIYYTDEVFYKLDSNTLNIYVCKCDTSEPKVAFNGVKIILNDLRTSDEIKDYSDNYQKYGLEKMSIYD